MSNHEYYGGPPPSDQDESQAHAGANPAQGYGSHDANHAPQGQKHNQNGYANSPYPQDPTNNELSAHVAFPDAPPQGYDAFQNRSYDNYHDPNRSTSPYPPHQVGQHDPNQHYGARPRKGHHDVEKGYEAQQNGQHSAPGEPAEGERGLGSTLVGGAGGALLGHKLGGGAMGTLGGMVVGAIGANVLKHEKDEHKKHKKHRKHSHSSHGDHGSELGDDSSHHGSHHSHSRHGSHSSHHGSHGHHKHHGSHHGSHSSHSHHGSHSSHSHHRSHSHNGSSHNGSSAGLVGLYVPEEPRRHHRSRSRGRRSSSSRSRSDSERR